MKTILCLIDILGFGGGAERQMIGLVQLLKERGYAVDVVVYHDSKDLEEIKRRYNLDPILLKVKNNPLSKLLAVRRFILQRGGFDIVIAYKGGPCIIGCILKIMRMRFKLIVSERIVTQVIDRLFKIKCFLYRFADVIVPNSYSQGTFIAKHFPYLANKISVITNFTDTVYFSPDNTVPSNKNLYVLTVARITPQKNILNYLEAIYLLRQKGITDVFFHWVGGAQNPNDEQYSRIVQQKVKELGLETVLTFHGQTRDIIEYYPKCDIFCLPSSFEGFPNVVCEAMSCGKPIACSRVCDNPRIVSESVNGLLFDPCDPKDIADKLKELIDMPEDMRKDWGRKSRTIALEMFSREAFVDKYISIIER